MPDPFLWAAHRYLCGWCSAVLPIFGISRPLQPSTSTAFRCCDPSARGASRTHLSTPGLFIHHGPMARFCFDNRSTHQLLRTFGRPRYMAYNVSEYMSAKPLTYYMTAITGLHGYLPCSPDRYYGCSLVSSVICVHKSCSVPITFVLLCYCVVALLTLLAFSSSFS